MDIRHLSLLAGQPCADAKSHEQFWGMPKRGLAFLLANVMFWQPMWAQADGIVVANPNTSMDRAGNGVPIINIATPNGSGLSHNQFHDYNVGAQGVILNNGSAQTTATQLGGHIVGNPNLKNSVAAQAILNEVISGNPSQLRGYTEVAGQSARVIVANPYGITCNGCGFINSPRVTLTTGKPVLDSGRLDRFQVDQGSVAIEGAGLNATNVDRFEIITRSAKINAQLQAQNLTIVAGRNDVNAQTLNATARADDGSAKPQLAIDSSALGGMYAGAIKLVGTEAGVGVKLDGKLIASGGDIQLDANGHLSLADTSATGALNVKAASLDAQGPVYAGTALNVQTQGNLTNRQTLAARDSVVLSAGGQLTNVGAIEAGVNAEGSRNASGDLSLTAQSLDNTGKSLVASRNLTVNTAQTLNNQGGTLSGQTNTITAGILDNRSGDISSRGLTRVIAGTVNNRSGEILGDLGLNIDLSGAMDNRDGVLGSGQSVNFKAASLDNREAGVLVSDGGLTVRIGGLLDNSNKGDISAKGVIDVQTGSVNNRDGKVIGKSTLALRSDVADNRAGVIQADQQLTLNIGQLDNREKGVVSGKAGINYTGTRLDNSGGLISAVGPVSLTLGEVQNAAGRISSQNDLVATIGLLQQQGGALVAQGNLSLTGKTLDNRNGGLVGSTKALTLNVDEIDNRSGEISSSLLMNIKGQRLDNSDSGKILAGSDLGLTVAKLINQSTGLITAKGATTLTGGTLDNSGGNFNSLKGLVITLDDALINAQGFISSEGTLTLKAGRVDNSAGSLSSAGNLHITSAGMLLNRAGSLSTNNELTLNSTRLDNSEKGLIYAKGNSRVDTGNLDNSQGGKLTSEASLTLKAAQVNNATGRIASQQALDVSVTGLDHQGGELFSKSSLTLDLNNGQLNNQKGLINAPGTLLLKNLNGVNNQGGEISSQQAFEIAAHDLDNSDGKLISQHGLTLRIAQALNNVKGTLSGTSLDSHSDSLDNHEGLISSRGEMLLTTDKTLDNQLGTVIADGQLTLTADVLDNTSGSIAGKTDAVVNAKKIDNQKGKLIATGALEVNADVLDNRQAGLLGATKALTLTVDDLDNRGGEISTNSDLQISGKKLDNSDAGEIYSGNALILTVDELINRNKGLISANTQLTLQGQSLDNSGGELLSQQNMRLTLAGAFDNTKGNVSSEGVLNVKTAQLTNVQGSLSSAEDLTLDSDGSVDNQGGKIVTDGALVLNSGSLDNRQKGTLSGKGAVTVTTGAFDNSSGTLSSADTLNLVAGQVTNSDAGSIGSQGALTASVTGLDQQGGKLFSMTRLSLDLNNGQLNNQNGVINAPGTLLLKQLNGVNNQGGTISSKEAFTLTAQSLDNSNGKLLSDQGLILRIANVLDNVKGIIGAASLDVHAASVNNSGGRLVSRGDLDLTVDGLLRNDDNALISAAQTLHIDSAELNNRDSGLIISEGNLTLTATDLDSSNKGEVSASGDIDLKLTSLSQNGGRLMGDKSVTIDLANGDLNNQNGLLTAKGPLTLKRLRDLNNQSGEVSSNLGFDLIARAVNNTSGKIISGEKLLLRGASLINQKGLMSGWQGLTVNGDSLDNRDSGTLSSKSADVTVDLKDALLNSGSGAVVAQGSLNIKAGSLDNSNKGNLSSGTGQTLTLAGALNNNQSGLIASGAALDIVSTAFTNVGGAINAQQAINATASRLDNSGGEIAGNGAITLNLSGQLNNNAGKLAGAGPVLINGVTDLINQNGQLASQKTLEVRTGSLDNSNKGTVAANDQLKITATGTVKNSADGLIYSQKADVQLKAASLLNGKGAIQSETALTLEVAGDFDNQSGKVIAQNGDVFVKAANIDNRGGTLSSIKGALEARTVGVLRNGFDLNNNRQGGIIQAQSLTLTALAGLNNNGGRISAQAADVSITTAALDNGNGVLYAKGLLGVTGASLNNAGGQIAANRIDFGLSSALRNGAGVIESDTQLTVKAASVDNQNGRLRSLGNSGKTEFRLGGLLDNRNGVLETANTDMTLAVGSFLNGGGQLNHVGRGKFDISTANVIGAGGGITTGGLLELNADTWSNSNVIQAGRLSVNVREFSQTASGKLLASEHLQARGGNWANEGLIASDGTLDMQIGGTYAGSGRLTSQRGAYLSVAQMNVAAGGSFAVGATSTVNVGGQLTNSGRMTSSEDLTINAGSVTNYGTLGATQNLNINTPSLLNDRGLIFSGNNMTLGVSTLTNQHGDFYGLGNVVIGGYGGAARAAGVYNISGSMESVGGFTINADVFENRTEGPVMSAGRKLISSFIAGSCGDCKGDYYSVFLAARETYQSTDSDTSASALLNVGEDFVFHGGTFLNSKSTVAAGGNITINAERLKNIGAKTGTIEVTRYYQGDLTDGGTRRFFANVVLPYNQQNNPDFPNVYYLDPQSNIRKAIPKSVRAWDGGGRDGEWYQIVSLLDSETGVDVGQRIYGRALSGLSYGFEKTTPSLYDPNSLVELPSQLSQFTLTDTKESAVDSTGATSTVTSRNAVIQAGGKVSITATREVANDVIREDYGSTIGTNKVADTKVGNTGTAVIRINSQLPPDLAQQQVNPLSLPGFSLPTGENGLFRLSGQGTTSVKAGNIGPAPTWTVGSEAVNAQDHLVAATTGGPRNLFIDAPAPVSDSTRAVDKFHRTPSVVNAVASTVDVNVPVNSADTGKPNRGNDMKESIDTRPVTRVTGLPDTTAPSNPHKYLIETNPVLTNLKSFMSSDYLLGKLGYDPDQSAKRLGDGLYEQRLIQQAVTARTGQAFLDGQTSNEGMFKYLMNNAIASKDALNLSVGVGLTAQQVAALTHDIVWLEEHEVNGEKVLVPVVYLAQANGRLGPTGALIAGNDVTLIAGENLDNVGTLKATNNLSAKAGKDLVNSGLVEAGNRLDLLAANNIVNKAGGIIAGRDVSLTTRTGDVINERTITSSDNSNRYVTQHHEYADNAARIEAANDLTVKAANDINIVGGVVQSGRDMALDAGRDVNVSSVQVNNSAFQDAKHNRSDVTQLGANIDAGRDFKADAKRDINVIASEIDAKRDVAMSATENMLISSAADEEHSLSKSKKVTRQEDHVSQVMSGITAGGDVSLFAEQNLAVVSSRVTAGDEAYLVAGDRLDILAAQDTDYSLYDMKKKGSFGKKKTKHDEVTDVKNISSEITSGASMVLASGGDQHYQAAKLDSGNDLIISSGGAVTFEGVKDLHQESHTKSNTSLSWNSMSGKGKTDETLRQSQLVAKGQLVINAVDGLNIDIKQINQKSISQTIDVMVQADPQLAWLKDAEKRGDVDWKLIKETHDSFKYSSSSLGQGAMLAIIIIVTVLTAGAASAAVGTAASAAAGSGTAMAAAGTATASAVAGGAAVGSTVAAGLGNVMASAILTSMASTAAVSTINNKGNLGAAVKDTFSKDSLKNAAIAGATAGFTKGVIDPQLGGNTVPFNNLTKGFDLSTLQGVGGFAVHAGAQGLAAGAIKTAIGGGSYSQNLAEGLVSQAGNVAAATAFNFVGGFAQDHWQAAKNAGDTTGMAIWAEGGAARTAMHALMGGAISSATGGDFKTGAMAAGASQALAGVLNSTFDTQPELRQAFSQIVGLTAAGLAGGDVNKASWVALMADEYNRQLHQKETLALEKLQKENPDKAYEFKAAACALVHCSDSVPPDDPNYKFIKALEADGKGFKDAQSTLFATGAFDEYSKWDQVNDDLLRNDKDLRQSANASRAVLGAIGAAAGFGGAIVSSPACVTAVGCAIPALSGLGGVASFADGWQATGQLFAPYDYSQGSKVLDSFSSATYPGDVNPLRDYGTEAAKIAMEIALLKGAGKYFEGTGASVLVSGGKKEGGLTGNTPKVSEVELNATRDAEGFGLSAQRDFAPGMEHRAENINAGQVTDRDGLPRVDGEKTANDLLLKQQSGGIDPPYWGTQRPAWKEGTIVRDSVVDQPRTMTMTINKQQYEQMQQAVAESKNPSSTLGGWATDTRINSVADVRNKLAVSEEFKQGPLFQVEFTVKPGVGIREGTVGDMWDAKNGVRLSGGGHQVNFMDKSPRTNPELYEVHLGSVRSLQ
ncbi:filamentous hemagglutinin N-terminal domain-containing protein [Pseudomonas iridis]|uniref:Filamentous hemagglutinin N-terminal domain-containing protein n=2 Tax=Pseudomonas iridis TaxID=2710587 RepID=A0ABW8DHE2_9PSED